MGGPIVATLAVFFFAAFAIISILREKPPIVRVTLIIATGLSFQLFKSIESGTRSVWILSPIALISLPAIISTVRAPTTIRPPRPQVELRKSDASESSRWGWRETTGLVVWFASTSLLSWLLQSMPGLPRVLISVLILIPLTAALIWFVTHPHNGGKSSVL